MFKNILTILFDPTEGFYRVKRTSRKREAAVLLAAAALVRILQVYLTSYAVNPLEPRYTNLINEVMTIVILVASWAVTAYMVTSIMDGQMGLLDYVKSTAYALIPYILLTLPFVGISHLLSQSSIAVYHLIQTVIFIWIGILLFIQVMSLNHYEFGRTVVVVLITVVGVVAVWVLFVILYVFTQNIVSFIHTIYQEILLILNS